MRVDVDLLLRCDLASQVAKMQAVMWPLKGERRSSRELQLSTGVQREGAGGCASLLTEAMANALYTVKQAIYQAEGETKLT